MNQTNWEDDPKDPDSEQSADFADEQDAQKALDEDLKKLQEERDSLFDRLARTTADFKNAQRRLEQDKEHAIQFANSGLIKTLIPVLDNLDRALSVDPSKAETATILKGMQIVQDQLIKALAAQGVEIVNPAPGTSFDPMKHEALMHQPSEKHAEPTIVQLLQKGYVMHGRTLRPAGVSVSP